MPTAYKGPDDISRPGILGNVIREIKVERRSKGMLIIFSAEPNVSNCPTLFVRSRTNRAYVYADRAEILRVQRSAISGIILYA